MRRLAAATLAALCVIGSNQMPAMASVVSGGESGLIPKGATYTISLPNYSVTDIVVFNHGSPFDYLTEGAAGNPLTAATPGPTTLTVTYLTAAEVPIPGFVYVPVDSFLLGVASNLTGDAAGQQHLVVFANDTFADSAQLIAFGTLFRNTNETTLTNDLVSQTNLGDIFTFASGDALNASIAFEPGSAFEAVAFSDGQIIGSGTSSFTYSVPEAPTWGMLMLGFVGLGLAGHRVSRKRQAATS